MITQIDIKDQTRKSYELNAARQAKKKEDTRYYLYIYSSKLNGFQINQWYIWLKPKQQNHKNNMHRISVRNMWENGESQDFSIHCFTVDYYCCCGTSFFSRPTCTDLFTILIYYINTIPIPIATTFHFIFFYSRLHRFVRDLRFLFLVKLTSFGINTLMELR